MKAKPRIVGESYEQSAPVCQTDKQVSNYTSEVKISSIHQ